MENRIKLTVLGLTYSQVHRNAYALVLAEVDGPRRIPIAIGEAEAQSIAIRLEGIVTPRPITHDLFVSFAQGFGIRLKEVYIYKFEHGVFSAEMLFDDGTREIRVDARTSDAIAVALRTRSEIFVAPDVIEKTGFVYEEDLKSTEESVPEKATLADYTREELAELLQKAIDSEEYEEAALIQAELNKRDNHL